ncbi:aminotransferase class I/II-fold pyridoxal phosphate-dependent enzyme [Sorangium sp. So ce260]|uniref:pyridoxal phosphate-dependent aminotransferase n=1 Tax=Sorangium sp. So ce260 TaxID=3133291 RepID=UPI003F618799
MSVIHHRRPVNKTSSPSRPRAMDDSGSAASSRHPTHLGVIREEIRRIERYDPPFADRSVTNLSLNEHYAPPSSQIQEALCNLDPMRLVTYDTEVAERLRARIAAREGVSIENIVLCPGSSSGLQLLFSCLAGGPLLVPSICWSYYLNLARLHGFPVARYDLQERAGEFQVEPASVAAALERDRPTLLLFIQPHMPTGALAPVELVLGSAEGARGTLVLVDEAYHGFSPAAVSVAREVLTHPNLIVSKTFSKYFGLAGIRMGYLVASAPVAEQLGKAASPFSVPFVSSLVALAALDSEAHYRALAVEMMAVKDAFARRVDAIPGLRAYRSHGNFLLVELPDADAAARAEADILAAGVAVRSARAYGLPSFLRISLGAAETMDRVATALERSEARHAAR